MVLVAGVCNMEWIRCVCSFLPVGVSVRKLNVVTTGRRRVVDEVAREVQNIPNRGYIPNRLK